MWFYFLFIYAQRVYSQLAGKKIGHFNSVSHCQGVNGSANSQQNVWFENTAFLMTATRNLPGCSSLSGLFIL